MKRISIFILLLLVIFISGCHKHNYIDGVCDCGEFDKEWLEANFNLDEEKEYYKGTIDDDFEDSTIIIVLKNSRTYPVLNERQFLLKENVTFEYLSSKPKRGENYTDEAWEEYLNRFHQIIFIHIESQGKDHVLELIKEIEKLPFVLSAEPNSFGYFDELE